MSNISRLRPIPRILLIGLSLVFALTALRLPGDAARPIDELAERTGLSVSSLLALLLGLELKGAVIQHPGKEFQRRM